MPDSPEPALPRVVVGRYARLAEARDRGLVIAARQLPHWIERDGNEWILLVEEAVAAEVRSELAAFENEQLEQPAAPPLLPATKTPMVSLFAAAWIMSGFFLGQQVAPESWEQAGVADSQAILAGQWWRTITALLLHGDGPHLAANLASGLLFAAFLIPRLGGGVAWLGILLSGALGNALNAWGYRGESHLSIGASTGCFGALGILVGLELFARWQEPQTRSRWQLILPIGAGLALLAFLGVGEEGRNVDYMAHCWGFIAGFGEGMIAQATRRREPASARVQRVAGVLTLAMIAAAWLRATA